MCGRFALARDGDDLAHDLQQQLFGHDNDLGQEQEEEATPDDEEQAQAEQEQEDESERNAAEALAELEAGDGAPVASGSSGASAMRKEAPVKAEGIGKASEGRSATKRIDWSSVAVKERFEKKYNVAPRSWAPVIRQTNPTTFRIDSLQWGLIPSWSKEPPQGPQHTINATCERLFEGGGTWGSVRDRKRCVVITSGFFEWQKKDSKTKLPHFVKHKDDKLMLMAGLWDKADYKGAFEEVSTFTIITVPVSKQLRFLHNRMPAILTSPEEALLWLSDKPWSAPIQNLVRTHEGELECYQVTPEVGKVGTQSPQYIEPLAKKKGTLSNMFAKQMASSPTKNPAPASNSDSPSKAKSCGGSTSSSLMSKSLSASSSHSTSTSNDEKPQLKKKKERKESSPLDTKAKTMARSFSDVIELSSDEEDEDKDSKPTPAKKAKVEEKAGGKKGSSPSGKAKAEIKKKVDKEGNSKVDSFFKKK